MIVIPTGTDAPIYHWPYVTVGMIVLNVVLCFAVPHATARRELDDSASEQSAGAPSRFERYALTIGDGRLHPIQWVTHNFLHYGLMHLAGNMLFLWSFGIVVEGKLGPLKYLLMYLAVGVLHGAFTQSLLIRSGLHEHAAGASAIVYGLLAICMIWAPRNELQCMVILFAAVRFLVFQWEFYYTTVALFYISAQAASVLFWGGLGGMLVLSELGHLSGAFWGAVVGIAILRAGWVDCEGWDLFSLWKKNRKLARDWKRRGDRLEQPGTSARSRRKASGGKGAGGSRDTASGGGYEAESAAAVRRFHALVERGDIPAALEVYQAVARRLFQWPAQADLYGMIKALHAQGADADSVPLMRDHCRDYPAESVKVRLKLAQTLMRSLDRPAAALKVLRSMPADPLLPELERTRQKLILQAERLCAEGAIEIEEDV